MGITDFVFDTPEPVLIEKYVQSALQGIHDAGFTGDEQYIAAHSLGTVMVQDYLLKSPKLFKGQVMMGGSLMRNKRSNDNSTGLTFFDYPVPTLVLAGNKDGLYRITRNAESYWH